jgi:site-specific DNA-methyltransferase (adenine-specific)
MINIYNEDCITGMQKLPSNLIDLIFTDPPYGIQGDTLDKHYNRDESKVIPGYVDVPLADYAAFSHSWITEAARTLKPGGTMYIVSGYTNLRHILNALASTSLVEVNHLIAKYTFGVYTKKKWVSSHYHILYYVKPNITKRTFNTHCRHADTQQSYLDRLSVQEMKREYKPGEVKNKNQLPLEFVKKFIQYSSNEGDTVLDPFMGGFTTATAALTLNRNVVGYELNKSAYDHFMETTSTTK